MGLRQLLGLQEAQQASEYAITEATVETLRYQLEQVTESFAQLQMAREDVGWARILGQYSNEFSREGLKKNAEQGRLFGVANPLIKRGRNVRHAYVWGQGVDISARDDAVNEVIQGFIDDEGNREAFYGAQARQEYEGCLYDEGNFFLAHFTNPLIGRVQVRSIPFDEVTDVITAPGDKTTPRFYLREWTELDEKGTEEPKKAYYPALKYQPAMRPKKLNEIDVIWDAPVRHVKVNGLSGWKFGIGDSFAAIPWALSHKGFLEDWALLMKALAKIAYTTTSKSAGAAQAKRAQIQSLAGLPAGSVASMTDDQKLEPVSKSGATLDSESSRPLATMAASAVDLPVTILLADPGQTGARATAETLDLPTRLIFQARQQLHREVYRDSIGYAVEQAVIAPRGPLRGIGKVVRDGDRLTVAFNDPADATVEVVFPPLDELPLDMIMSALEKADGMTVKPPPVVFLKLVLQALRVPDIDEIIDQLTDADGNYIDPEATAGEVAAKAFRDGQNPADALK
ncbi:portal protein [Arthrobacter phage TripleJ]|uniref:Portal protein n=1 Tax=Arthrobacter phage TripleJ TaxID=2599838 RepID=A0A5J6TFL1_9CAUD|nr:portal protein [Arthrobacter phage TripleJ]QFG09546.1 portal protein [Arthrobacter phage TripleJ]